MRTTSGVRTIGVCAMALGAALAARPAAAQEAAPAPAPAPEKAPPPSGEAAEAEAALDAAYAEAVEVGAEGGATSPDVQQSDSSGYTPSPEKQESPLRLTGYIDVGFADADGDGTSWHGSDTRVPGDYGVDTFQTAVNSRGDVASTDGRGRVLNGFLPRSVGIGGKPSFLVNTVDVDVRYTAPGAPVFLFARLQFMPRFLEDGEDTRVDAQQAFVRVSPFSSQELALFVGKFDSVFGIEYLDNEANLRTGITPSLIARYTTGHGLGTKLFYRLELAPLWSAVSVNGALTNGGTMVESIRGPDASLTGRPVASVRVGYELNLPHVQVKLGGSGLRGPRNDQPEHEAMQSMVGADARLYAFGFSLAGEYVRVWEDEGPEFGKQTGLGAFEWASGFFARGYWAQAAYALDLELEWLRRVTPYARYDWRNARFLGFTNLEVDRLTGGLRVDVIDALAVKVEYLNNRERRGAPAVDNDVKAASVVYTW